MRHLITGGAGFIGSHLANALVARGDEVVVNHLATAVGVQLEEAIDDVIAFRRGRAARSGGLRIAG